MSKTVYILDDDPQHRQLCSMILTKNGYQSISFDHALALNDKKLPCPVMIFLDYHLPDANGPSLVKDLKTRWPTAQIIFMSADCFALEAIVENANVQQLLPKPLHFIEKPLSQNALTGLLSKIAA